MKRKKVSASDSMLKGLTLCLFCLALISCQQGTNPPPNDLIPREQFVQLLAEVHLNEAAKHTERNLSYRSLANRQTTTFESHNTTREAFINSYNYYAANPAVIFAIYEDAIAQLKMEKEHIEKQQKEQARQDSIAHSQTQPTQ